MNEIFSNLISVESGISLHQVAAVIKLLSEGCTIPFISRYRKEATGALDEVQVASISDRKGKLEELAKRKETILSTIAEQGKLTDDLKKRIEESWNATELEDIYAPFKPKKRTRAEIARQKGLEPLADFLLRQGNGDPQTEAKRYIGRTSSSSSTVEEALQGAMDIIAERVSENESARNKVRNNFRHDAVITSKVVNRRSKQEQSQACLDYALQGGGRPEVKGKEQDGQKFRDYFDFSEKLSRCASHRLLAMRRGEAEGFLKVSINGDDDLCLERLEHQFVRSHSRCGEYVAMAVADGYKRLLRPSIETEFAASSKEKADEEAIKIFVKNLEQLLMAAPLGQKRVLAIDPGFRTGCKVVCLDREGNLLHNEAIFPHPPHADREKASNRITSLVRQYQTEAISIGNGTASRETESFIRSLPLGKDIQVFVVSEDGASIYSASKVAREEFPDYDVTVRGAVSIGRRLMDPLAELVKIDPNSIGVGQYQKDVNQTELKHSLDYTVVSCVNKVGVNLNTASKHLLTYISGLGPAVAKNIVDYRAENGAFQTRRELLKVPKLGPKAFEQCAGFLRIEGGKQPLDNSAVHPESYHIVEKMAKDQHCTVEELMKDKAKRDAININDYVTDTVGLMTLNDIMQELDKPSRDPRTALSVFEFDSRVHELQDVQVGMTLPGIVTNITNFGCFVDIGVHTDGLVHISQVANRFIKDITEVVTLQQQVLVKVIDVDLVRKRLSLSMRDV